MAVMCLAVNVHIIIHVLHLINIAAAIQHDVGRIKNLPRSCGVRKGMRGRDRRGRRLELIVMVHVVILVRIGGRTRKQGEGVERRHQRRHPQDTTPRTVTTTMLMTMLATIPMIMFITAAAQASTEKGGFNTEVQKMHVHKGDHVVFLAHDAVGDVQCSQLLHDAELHRSLQMDQ